MPQRLLRKAGTAPHSGRIQRLQNMADDAIYRLAHRDAYNASFAARKTQKVNVAAQAATPTRFLTLKDDNAGALGNVRIGTRKFKRFRAKSEAVWAAIGQLLSAFKRRIRLNLNSFRLAR